jgi:hypothetical protein
VSGIRSHGALEGGEFPDHESTRQVNREMKYFVYGVVGNAFLVYALREYLDCARTSLLSLALCRVSNGSSEYDV